MKKITAIVVTILGLSTTIIADDLSPEEKFCNNLVYDINYGDDSNKESWTYNYGRESVGQYVAGYSSALLDTGNLNKKLTNTAGTVLVNMVCEEALVQQRKRILKNPSKSQSEHEMFFLQLRLATSTVLMKKNK